MYVSEFWTSQEKNLALGKKEKRDRMLTKLKIIYKEGTLCDKLYTTNESLNIISKTNDVLYID